MSIARASRIRAGAMAVVLIAGSFFVVVLHLRHRGESSLAASEKALAEGDVQGAIAWARDAALAVAPFSPYPEVAYGRLADIAARAEEHGDFVEATAAWRAVWTSIRATRKESAERARLEDASQALVRLAGRACEGDQSRPPAVCAAAAQAALREGQLPELSRFRWLALAAVAFLGGGAFAAMGAGRARLLGGGVALFGLALAAAALALR